MKTISFIFGHQLIAAETLLSECLTRTKNLVFLSEKPVIMESERVHGESYNTETGLAR